MTAAERLRQAGLRALVGEHANDAWRAYDLTIEDAVQWAAGYSQELAHMADEAGVDRTGPDWTLRLLVGARATGIEFGRDTPRQAPTAP